MLILKCENLKCEKVIYLSDHYDIFNPDEGIGRPKHVVSANTLIHHQQIYTVVIRSTVILVGLSTIGFISYIN